MILAKCGIKIKFEIIQQTKIRTNQGIISECRVRPHYSWCLHRTKAHNSFEHLKSARETRKFKRISLQKTYFKKLRDFQSIHIFFGVFGRHFPVKIKGSQKKQLHV